MTTGEPAAIPAGPDSEGCLLVVAGYADIAPDLRPVTAEAAASIIRSSPELGDFFEVRFTDIGPRPEAAGGQPDAVSLIATELTRPTSAADRYYFALVVAERSAAVAEQLIKECQANPVIAALPMRYRGLASIDDRQAGTDEGITDSSAEIVMPSAGAWDRVSLVHDLRCFAEQLLEDFAAGNEPGLTSSQLPPADDLDPLGDQPLNDAAAGQAARPPIAASSDVLSPQREEPHPRPPEEGPALWRPAVPAASRRSRRLPALWRGHHPSDPAVSPPPEEQAQHTGRLALLILLGDEDIDDKGAWRRGRSVILEIDKKFADARHADYRVSTLRSTGAAAMSEPRPAGNLTRRDMRRPNASLDFPRILSMIHTVIKRDCVAGIAGPAFTQPIVIFFAADVPLADAVTAELYGELAHEAFIAWIVPQDLEALLSPRLKEESAWVLPDHQAVGDELITLLHNRETTDAAGAGEAITSNERSAG